MTNPKNHKIERSSSTRTSMSASWAFTDSDNNATNRNFQIMGTNVDTGDVTRMYTFPANDGTWSNSDTSDTEKDFIWESSFFPNTRWKIVEVVHHVQMQNQWPITTDVQGFSFAEPLPPDVSLTRNDLKLTWTVDAKTSDMPYTSKYARNGTKCWLETTYMAQGWPNHTKYRMPTATKDFSGSKDTITYDATSLSYTPSTPTRFRVVAANYGPSGMSELTYGETHVFAQVKTPIISLKTIKSASSNNVTAFSVNANADEWHPVDHIVLERQIGTSMQTGAGSSWTTVEDVADVASNVNLMTDETSDQVPGADNATFWRIKVWHDDASANCAYAYPMGQPFRAGKPKAPESVNATINQDTSDAEYGYITATWTIKSDCSPQHVAELWCKKTANGAFEKIESKTVAAGTATVKFSKDYSTMASYMVRVQAYKDWSPTQKLSSDWEYSSSMAKTTIGTISLLDDGVSIYVDETHDDDDADYTEYSWHTRGDGWSCTEEPKTYNRLSTGSASHVSIAGLDEGMEYYVQARRYDSKTQAFGPYSAQVSTQTGGTPGTPTLTATGSVSAGDSIEYEWDFSGGTQQAAMLYIVQDIDRTQTFTGDGTTTAFDLDYEPDSTPTVTVNGTASTAFTLSDSTITFTTAPSSGDVIEVSYRAEGGVTAISIDGDDMGYAYDTDPSWTGRVKAYVKVTTGGNWSQASLNAYTDVEQPPTCTVAAYGTLDEDADYYGGLVLTALPLTLTLGGTSDLFDVSIRCANSTSFPSPGVTRRISAGTNVAWASSCAPGNADIITDRGVLAGGGQYDVTVIGRDATTGAKSEPVTFGFTVDWENEAQEPTVNVEIVNGDGHVTVTANAGGSVTDTLDIWRKTADGAVKCASDAAFGEEYIDKVPPYGWSGNAYIAQVTTIDGDTCWVEGTYSLPSPGVTVNWEDESVILPWNIDFSCDYSTQFEARAHLDGSRTGYWQAGGDRTASASGVLRKDADIDEINSFRRLGKYAGIAFVRDTRGKAFACNADVTVAESYSSGAVDIDISMTEVDDDGTWRAQTELETE